MLSRLLSNAALRLLRWAVADRRPPDVTSRTGTATHLKRWYLWPHNRWCNLILHQWYRGDDRRHLHDHPWSFFSWVLRGWYAEIVRTRFQERAGIRSAGTLAFRHALTPHRVSIPNGLEGKVWTLLLTGPTHRKWRLYNRHTGADYPYDAYIDPANGTFAEVS